MRGARRPQELQRCERTSLAPLTGARSTASYAEAENGRGVEGFSEMESGAAKEWISREMVGAKGVFSL